VNWAFARLAGLGDPADAVGKTESECFPGELGHRASATGRKILETGTPVIGQCDEWDRGDKGIRWFSTTRVPICSPIDGRIDSLVGVSIDITERKELEKHLTEAKQAAEEAVRAKEQFLARISHEIRTPLNSVLGMADLLSASELTESQRQYVKVLQTNNEMLLRMTSDLIDLSRGDLNELKLTAAEFNPRHAVKAVIDSLERAAAVKGIELISQIGDTVPVSLIGDCERLKQRNDRREISLHERATGFAKHHAGQHPQRTCHLFQALSRSLNLPFDQQLIEQFTQDVSIGRVSVRKSLERGNAAHSRPLNFLHCRRTSTSSGASKRPASSNMVLNT